MKLRDQVFASLNELNPGTILNREQRYLLEGFKDHTWEELLPFVKEWIAMKEHVKEHGANRAFVRDEIIQAIILAHSNGNIFRDWADQGIEAESFSTGHDDLYAASIQLHFDNCVWRITVTGGRE